MPEEKIYKLENRIQDYAWGTRNVLNQLFNIPNPNNKPQAEIWMGAHTRAPSTVLLNRDTRVSLIEFIRENPGFVLGPRVNTAFEGKLPFLFKVLSAAAPLSIQAHPDKTRAAAGFEIENNAGIELSAPRRNYKDPNHKPELIYAVTPFKALKGFREIPEIIALLEELDIRALKWKVKKLKDNPTPEGLKSFYTCLMRQEDAKKRSLIEEAVIAARGKENHAFNELLNLHSYYSGDIGILCAVLLNLVVLQPGEAMYLESGELHSYICGTGMEIMANSDNVLRGGLTPKHVDVEELLATLSFKAGGVAVLGGENRGSVCETVYPTPAAEFELRVIRLTGGCDADEYVSDTGRSVEILFCGSGRGTISITGRDEGTPVFPGESYLVPAAVPRYTVSGNATLFKATVP